MATAKPLSWNEIRERSVTFVADWRGETKENAEAQTFWNEWFNVFGIQRRNYVRFEHKAMRESTGGRGRIDAFWEGQVAVEHKSAGKSLEEAERQALDYLEGLHEQNIAQPRMIITSDFGNFRVLDLERNTTTTFDLDDFPNEIERFGFIAGYESRTFEPEDDVNIEAAELMGNLYDALADTGYRGHDLKVFLVRLMFLYFADDTGVWEKGLFDEFIERRTAADGSDTGPLVGRLFRVLDTPENRRTTTLDSTLARFPYINGGLFSERIDLPDFNTELRAILGHCSSFDWSAISPAVFGSLFQSVMDADARRALGAHYTSEQNILKLLGPLFLDELRAEEQDARNSVRKLRTLKQKLGKLKFFDPAAGCGNFLIIAYRELRRLEFDILVRLAELEGDRQVHLDIDAISGLSTVNVDQFYAIEIEEFPARIAETALYLVDHLENMRLSKKFGQYFARIPLTTETHIHVGNALEIDWESVVPAKELTYLLGNPPFIGALRLNPQQTADRARSFAAIPEAQDLRAGRLDYVMCWYAKAMQYLKESTARAAFVSTNSVTQGEQARSLGPLLSRLGFQIDFAHRTFNWQSEARGRAIVHVVIIGFSVGGRAPRKQLFDYIDISGSPIVSQAQHINAWLLDASDVEIAKRSKPFIPDLPVMTVGSQPTDGGHLLIDPEELSQVEADPIAAKYVRRLYGATEMLTGKQRWCLWLVEAAPQDLRNSPVLRDRLEAVRALREQSPTASFRRTPPHLFTHLKQPTADYIGIPQHSAENRRIVPMSILPVDSIAHNSLMLVREAPLWLFGLLQSEAFTDWSRIVCGRIKSDIRISADMAYNAYPFPELTDRVKARLADSAKKVLEARRRYPESSLSDLYFPNAMPADLVKAHNELDRVVDGLYGFRKVPTEAERAARLFERYAKLAG